MKTLIIVGVLVVLALVVLYPGNGQVKALYIVDERDQVLVTRFGEVQTVKRSPGIYLKLPFADTVIRFDRRILRIDAPPVAMPDKEKQNLVIDSYARYRITDPVQFRKTLQTEANARSRLGDIVTSALRAQIALRDRNEIIGSKPVLDEQGNQKVDQEEGLPLIESSESRTALLEEVVEGVRLRIVAREVTQREVIPVLQGRPTFTVPIPAGVLDADNSDRDADPRTGVSATDVRVTDGPDGNETPGIDIIVTGLNPAGNTLTLGLQEGETVSAGTAFTVQYFVEREEPFGLEIVDVRIKRADFPDSVTPSIFTRMRAERNRIATKFRAEGDEQDLQIRAGANRDREIILAQADQTSNQLRGEGEADAIRILAEALEEDPEFFAFRRSLEAYQRVLNTGTTVILSADADLFRFLDSPGQGVE